MGFSEFLKPVLYAFGNLTSKEVLAPVCKGQDRAIPLNVLQKANGWIFFVNVLFPDFIIPKEIPFFVVVADLLIFQTGDAEYVLCDVILQGA